MLREFILSSYGKNWRNQRFSSMLFKHLKRV